MIDCINPNRKIFEARKRETACSSTYQLAQRGQDVHVNVDKMSYEEGREKRMKRSLSLDASVKTLDRAELETPQKEVNRSLFPSQEQEQEKAQVIEEPQFRNPAQVGMLFGLQRKLRYRADDERAAVFDALEHADKKRYPGCPAQGRTGASSIGSG